MEVLCSHTSFAKLLNELAVFCKYLQKNFMIDLFRALTGQLTRHWKVVLRCDHFPNQHTKNLNCCVSLTNFSFYCQLRVKQLGL